MWSGTAEDSEDCDDSSRVRVSDRTSKGTGLRRDGKVDDRVVVTLL